MSEAPFQEEPPLLPEWALRLLEYVLPETHRWTVPGDFAEVFSHCVVTEGWVRAWWAYVVQVVASLPAFFLTSLIVEGGMIRNYWTVAVRNLSKHKGYTFINISGLAIGVACCLLIVLFIRDELRFDQHHEHADRIVRVHWSEAFAFTPSALAPTLREGFPEVESVTRLDDQGAFRPAVVAYEDKFFEERGVFYADSTVFDVFTLPLIAGDPQTALTRPRTVVLSASAARKYFGDADPIGKVLRINADGDYEVTGVMEDLPSTSHVQFDLLISFVTLSWSQQETWRVSNFWTYVLLRDSASRASLEAKLPDLLDRVRRDHPGEISEAYQFDLYPLTDLYLYYQGHSTYVYLFAVIALLMLLVACVNYMNLATARAARRAREVGLRKVLGAQRGQLLKQFFGESALTTALGIGGAVALVYMALPLFRTVSGKNLDVVLWGEGSILGWLFVLAGVVTVLAGSYPAMVLSAFRPVQALRGVIRGGRRGQGLRHGLVIFQFTVSAVLLIGTAIVYDQLTYMQTTNLGFDKEHVVVLPIGDRELRAGYPALKEELVQHPRIESAAAIHAVPGRMSNGYWVDAEGLALPEGEKLVFNGVRADQDVVETMGMTLIAGPGFPTSDSYSTEQGYVYIINETALGVLGWTAEDAIGKRFSARGERGVGEVVGVVEDFHHESLHSPIEPLVLFIQPGTYLHLLVKVAPGQLQETMGYLESAWQRRAPHRPFTYEFLDQQVEALYRSEAQISQIFTAFAVLAILIACLGLFGLVAFAAEQRTKEIGVRKVLGAGIGGIIGLLLLEFGVLVAVALLVAIPVGYFAMSHWLDTFAYRTDIGVGVFVGVGILTLAIATLTVGYHTLKMAFRNPVEALRHE